MNRLCVHKFSPRFAAKRLSESDIPAIYELCTGNSLFYKYCGRTVTEADIRNDMALLPPGKDMGDKYYVGFWDGACLVAILDLIDGYPDPETAFIGFFMTQYDHQRTGVGTSIIASLCAYLKQTGIQRVRLAAVKDNPQARSFWKKNHFTDVKEVAPEDSILVLCQRTL